MWKRLAPLGALLLAGLSACTSTRPAPLPAEAPAIRAAADRLFAAMLARDTTALRALLHPSALVVGVDDSGTRTVAGSRWIRSFGGMTDTLRERLWNPTILVDGNLAHLWAPYDFYAGRTFSHCGHDSFGFVRENGVWRFTLIAFTRQTVGCPAPPANVR